MDETPKGDPRAPAPAGEAGGDLGARPNVMTGLPRARPQRASARRAAARPGRRIGEGPSVLAGLPRARPQRASARRAAARAARARDTPAPVEEPVPRQGFETEPDQLSGPVQPPGGAELAASAGELAAELAKAGIATSARLVKDLLSRLPG
ncbi:MAG TPA: hypothetical protein VES65_09730 [Solirubrobacteraceae bacterium]|nr:hypothetical protein [Solirubrobacteraceae bacterium]